MRFVVRIARRIRCVFCFGGGRVGVVGIGVGGGEKEDGLFECSSSRLIFRFCIPTFTVERFNKINCFWVFVHFCEILLEMLLCWTIS